MMEYNDPDIIQDERDEEQIKNDNLVEIWVQMYFLENTKLKNRSLLGRK